MSPKVKTVKSSETTARKKLNKSSIHKENCNNWIESDEPRCFNETINTRETRFETKKVSAKTIFPSISGSTRCPKSGKTKYTAKFYRRRLKQCKTLIKILIAAKKEPCVKKYIEKCTWILDDCSHRRNSREKRSVKKDSVEEKKPRAPRTDVIDSNSDSDQAINNAKKSGAPSKTGKKIPEGKSVPSTSKQVDKSDDGKSAIRSMNSQRDNRDQENFERENLSNSSDDMTIITRGQPEEESQGLRSDEIEEASESSVSDDIIGWSAITNRQKNVQKLNSRIKNIVDHPKGQVTNSVINSPKSTATSKRNEKAGAPSKSENSNPLEIVNIESKPAATEIGCLCKRKKLKSLPTLSYKVPSDSKKPTSKFCNHEQRGSEQEVKIEKTSAIHDKKGKKLYSPLELNYSEGSKNLVKENEKISEPLPQVNKESESRERGSKNCEGPVACGEPVKKNRSKQSRHATFSTYSIPVSIEIHMIPDKMKARNLSGKLKQTTLTNYYPLGRAQDRRSQRKNVDSNLADAAGEDTLDENGNEVMAVHKNPKPRTLPVVKSDVLLDHRAGISFSDKIPWHRPKLRISSQNYLYNLVKYPQKQSQNAANQSGKQNIIFCNNVTLSQQYNVTNEPADYDQMIPNNVDDGDCSIVPPSYSVSADDVNDDPPAIQADLSLDTEQWEEMLAPWDKVDSFEKVKLWNGSNEF